MCVLNCKLFKKNFLLNKLIFYYFCKLHNFPKKIVIFSVSKTNIYSLKFPFMHKSVI